MPAFSRLREGTHGLGAGKFQAVTSGSGVELVQSIPSSMPAFPQAMVAMDERQDSWESTHFTAVVDACPPSCNAAGEDAAAAEDADHTSEAPKKKGRRGGKRRVTAEEKDAKVRARNRRAQQAFRKRQKALAMERCTSLTLLEAEVARLKQSNKDLHQALQQAQAELAKEKVINTNHASLSQQQDLQMMAMFPDAPQAPSTFLAAHPSFDDDEHFTGLWPSQPVIDPPVFPPTELINLPFAPLH